MVPAINLGPSRPITAKEAKEINAAMKKLLGVATSYKAGDVIKPQVGGMMSASKFQ